MADRQVVEKELVLKANEPNKWSEIGVFKRDRAGYRIDDTVGPIIDLVWAKGEVIPHPELVVFAIGLRLKGPVVYYRTLTEYRASDIAVCQRYRIPFVNFEGGSSGRAPDVTSVQLNRGNKASMLQGNDVVYQGNPDVDVSADVTVTLLAPAKIDPKKSKISLQFVELHGHPCPKEIVVMPPPSEMLGIMKGLADTNLQKAQDDLHGAQAAKLLLEGAECRTALPDERTPEQKLQPNPDVARAHLKNQREGRSWITQSSIKPHQLCRGDIIKMMADAVGNSLRFNSNYGVVVYVGNWTVGTPKGPPQKNPLVWAIWTNSLDSAVKQYNETQASAFYPHSDTGGTLVTRDEPEYIYIDHKNPRTDLELIGTLTDDPSLNGRVCPLCKSDNIYRAYGKPIYCNTCRNTLGETADSKLVVLSADAPSKPKGCPNCKAVHLKDHGNGLLQCVACDKILYETVDGTLEIKRVSEPPAQPKLVDASRLKVGMLLRVHHEGTSNPYGVIRRIEHIVESGAVSRVWAEWRTRASEAIAAYSAPSTSGSPFGTHYELTEGDYEIVETSVSAKPSAEIAKPKLVDASKLKVGMLVRVHAPVVNHPYGVVTQISPTADYRVFAIWCDSSSEATAEYLHTRNRTGPTGSAFSELGGGMYEILEESVPDETPVGPKLVDASKLKVGMLVRDHNSDTDPHYGVVRRIEHVVEPEPVIWIWAIWRKTRDEAIMAHQNCETPCYLEGYAELKGALYEILEESVPDKPPWVPKIGETVCVSDPHSSYYGKRFKVEARDGGCARGVFVASGEKNTVPIVQLCSLGDMKLTKKQKKRGA